MSPEIRIVAAGNILATALTILRDLGYEVTRSGTSASGYVARKLGFTVVGNDTLQLLALATIAERRGQDWAPSDTEIDALMALDAT